MGTVRKVRGSSAVTIRRYERPDVHAFGTVIHNCTTSPEWRRILHTSLKGIFTDETYQIGVYQKENEKLILWMRVPSILDKDAVWELMYRWYEVLKSMDVFDLPIQQPASPTLH